MAVADTKDAGFGEGLLILGMSFLVLTVAAIVVFTIWYRRNDRQVQLRLKAARAGELVLPPPDAIPLATPVASTAEAQPHRSVRPEHETGGGVFTDDPSRN